VRPKMLGLSMLLLAPAVHADTDPLEKVKVVAAQPYRGGGLRETITVNVENLDTLLDVAAKANTKVVLFLGGLELTDVSGRLIRHSQAGQPGALGFSLERSTKNQDAWKALLSRPGLVPKSVVASVGLPGQKPVNSDWTDFQLTVIHVNWLVAWGVFFLLLLTLFLIAARKSSIVREAGTPLAGEAAYSLGRCQMAWWFFIVLAAYLFLFMVTWNYDTITAGTLALIGITAATGLSGAVVDTSKREAMIAEKTKLQAELAGAPPPNAQRVAEINRRIQDIDTEIKTPAHQKWYLDLLTDSNGLSFHRFQMFVWTIVLGVIFVISVYTDLIMPDFSATLLGLMGISSGTYIGFKFPETKN
jgi:hypothetical protein